METRESVRSPLRFLREAAAGDPLQPGPRDEQLELLHLNANIRARCDAKSSNLF
jgi:hypothetical protein